MEAARRTRTLFAPGEEVEVRTGFSQASGGKAQLVIYARAKVVSASAGTCSYLVQYPAANGVPTRTARVPASDVRAAGSVLPSPSDSAVNVARPASSSKRPLPPSEKSDRGGADYSCKKAKTTGKGFPAKDALRNELDKEDEAKKKKARGYGPKFPASPRLLPAPVKAAVATRRKVAAPEKAPDLAELPAPRLLPAAPVKAAIATPTRKVATPEKSNTVRIVAAKRTSAAPPKSLAPTAETAPRKPRFACGDDVEVRSSQASGTRQVVIYAPAKVVSVSAGTDSYLVRYPATNSIPSRTARVAASDVRAARHVPPATDRSGSGGDCRHKER